MKKLNSLVIITFFFLSSQIYAGGKWYNFYAKGQKAMLRQNWPTAIAYFKQAIAVKPRDTKKIKTYGMHFIKYFPHREIGICYYYMGQFDKAKRELNISLRQEYSARAQEYLLKITSGTAPETPVPTTPIKSSKITPKIKQRLKELKSRVQIKEPNPSTTATEEPSPSVTTSSAVKLVGERMGIAVLPFQTKGLGMEEMGEINIVEQMMTTFYKLNRFKLFERTQLEKILEEQKLGMSGVLDASTAAEIGKGIGVDAIVLGSVTRAGKNIAIDARLIDTETAEIITAQDEMSSRTSIQDLKNMISRLAMKIYNDLPLVEGYVIKVEGDQLTLDMGANKGVKKGMKCVVYREGPEIIHPVTKKVLGKETEELGIIRLVQVFPEFSVGKVIKSESGMFEVGNKVVTK